MGWSKLSVANPTQPQSPKASKGHKVPSVCVSVSCEGEPLCTCGAHAVAELWNGPGLSEAHQPPKLKINLGNSHSRHKSHTISSLACQFYPNAFFNLINDKVEETRIPRSDWQWEHHCSETAIRVTVNCSLLRKKRHSATTRCQRRLTGCYQEHRAAKTYVSRAFF